MRIRLITGLGLAVVALLGLTACRSNPAVAAYVGDQTITESQVSQLLDDHKEQAPKQTQPTRTVVVNYLVDDKVCRLLQDKLGFAIRGEPKQPVPTGFVQTDWTRLQDSVAACLASLPQGDPVKPTEADARAVFDIGVEHGFFPAEAASQLVPRIAADPALAAALSKKQKASAALDGVDVSVNPKYGVIQLPIATFIGTDAAVAAVYLPFGGSDVVVDQ